MKRLIHVVIDPGEITIFIELTCCTGKYVKIFAALSLAFAKKSQNLRKYLTRRRFFLERIVLFDIFLTSKKTFLADFLNILRLMVVG